MQGETRDAELLTTREVAGLLRIKERKVYDLGGVRRDPRTSGSPASCCSPRAVDAWLLRHSEAHAVARAAGRTSSPAATTRCSTGRCANPGAGLASFFDGSLDGLERIARRDALAAGLHLVEGPGWNVGHVERRAARRAGGADRVGAPPSRA